MNNKDLKLENLFDLATVLSQQNNFHEILRLVTQKVSELFNADITLIMMLNPRTQHTVKTIFKEGQESSHPRYQAVHNQISGWLIKYRQPLLAIDIKKDKRFGNVDWSDLPVKSVIGVPMQTEGNLIGSLILVNKNNPLFRKSDRTFLEKFSIIVSPYLRNVKQIQHYFDVPLTYEILTSKYKATGLLGKSKSFNEMLQAIEAAARCDVRVLLEGQSGTGKELIARAIHTFSSRSEKPFIAIDCGAIPDHLIESELFGHVKGAFTGATQDRKGLFQQANQGILFMDEITNLPLDVQSKLLRVLQENQIRPVGSDNVHDVDVRIVAAASTSLQKMVEENKFREDLFYRLHVYPIIIPSLEDRTEDIPAIANCFLAKFNDSQNKNIKYFHGQVMGFMCTRTWKGNIRELINFIERLVTLTPTENTIIEPDIIPADLRAEFLHFIEKQEVTSEKSLKERLFESEKEIIQNALIAHNWNQTKAAQSLDLNEALIRYRMKKLGIRRPK
jgi:transcriptional regulator with GAF, ATPase, and Fis domain